MCVVKDYMQDSTNVCHYATVEGEPVVYTCKKTCKVYIKDNITVTTTNQILEYNKCILESGSLINIKPG